MAERTAIEWCDSTLNPWIGCTRVSPACDDCYAARSTPARTLAVVWGPGEPRRRTSATTWKQPLAWNARPFVECMACRWRGEARLATMIYDPPGFEPPVKSVQCCPRCKEPTLKQARRRVFCSSLADVFDNEVPPIWRADLFTLIKATPDLDWLLLTKRIGNAWKMMADACGVSRASLTLPLHNVWLGATVVNQEEADRDIPKLLRVPAAVRFLSIEPMLGPVRLNRISDGHPTAGNEYTYSALTGLYNWDCVDQVAPRTFDSRIHWVICGGESGPKARPLHPDWAYSLRDQCAAAGVPFFFKQVGEWASPGMRAFGTVKGEVRHIDSAGQFLEPPPADENADFLTVVRVGKRAAGRVLGNRTHDEFPKP